MRRSTNGRSLSAASCPTSRSGSSIPRPDEARGAGEAGELCVRGYNVMKGYYNNPEATRAAIDADGWLRTGDEATIDGDGVVRITGRIKDLIIRGGENISPKEIEDCLREHPDVADAQVYGLAGHLLRRDRGGGGSRAFGPWSAVRRRCSWRGVPPGSHGSRCRSTCGSSRSYPLTASGKVQKYKLREAHQAQLASTSRRSGRPATATSAP